MSASIVETVADAIERNIGEQMSEQAGAFSPRADDDPTVLIDGEIDPIELAQAAIAALPSLPRRGVATALDPRIYVTVVVLAAVLIFMAPVGGFDSAWFDRFLGGGLLLFGLTLLAGLLDFIWSWQP